MLNRADEAATASDAAGGAGSATLEDTLVLTPAPRQTPWSISASASRGDAHHCRCRLRVQLDLLTFGERMNAGGDDGLPGREPGSDDHGVAIHAPDLDRLDTHLHAGA